MKRFILLAFITSNYLFSMAQSIDSEKFEWTWQQSPLYKLPSPLKSFSSSVGFLEVKGLPRQSGADIVLDGGVYPAVPIQSPDILSMGGTVSPWYSQVYWVEAKTKDKKTIYYRIFNEFNELGLSRSIDPGQPISNAMFYYSYLGKQVSYIFADFKNKEEFKLFYVKKSTTHDDINQACALARKAIRMMAADSFAQANQQLELAVGGWNEALKESNIDDKNARINKKVSEALYKDLIPSLILLNRFDEAQTLITKSEKLFGMFYGVFTGKQSYFMKKKKLGYLGSTSNPALTLNDIDLPDNVTLITSASRLNVPHDLNTVQKILAGSWRTVSIRTEMPKSDETYVRTNDPQNDVWHFLPNGEVYLETGKTTSSLDIKMERLFWQGKKTMDGKIFFATASKLEDLKPKEKFINFTPYEILHLTFNTMLLRLENINPDLNVKYYYIQLQRVNLVLD